jgi:hypothetical protein
MITGQDWIFQLALGIYDIKLDGERAAELTTELNRLMGICCVARTHLHFDMTPLDFQVVFNQCSANDQHHIGAKRDE